MYRSGAIHPPILLVALGGHVAGLDPDTGRIRWSNELVNGGYGDVDLAMDGEFILASASGNRIFALAYGDGRTLWSAETTGHGRTTIVFEGERIYIAKGGFIDAYSRTGERLWKQDLPGFGTGRATLGFPGNLRQADDVGSQ